MQKGLMYDLFSYIYSYLRSHLLLLFFTPFFSIHFHILPLFLTCFLLVLTYNFLFFHSFFFLTFSFTSPYLLFLTSQIHISTLSSSSLLVSWLLITHFTPLNFCFSVFSPSPCLSFTYVLFSLLYVLHFLFHSFLFLVLLSVETEEL